MYRVLLCTLLIVLLVFQYRYWFGPGGVQEVRELQIHVEAQQKENTALEQRNAALIAEVEDLREGEEAVEERARLELGLIRPGETYYRVIESLPEPADATGDQPR